MTTIKRSRFTPTNGNSQATRATRRSAYLLVGAALTLICSGVVSASTSIDQLGADIDGEAAGDYSGQSVAMSSDGTIIAIGADQNDGNGTDSGHVRVYEWNGSAWTQKGGDIDGEDELDYAGTSVALSSDGTTVAIGAKYNDGNGDASGHVRVYDWNGSAWVQKGADINGEAAGDESGGSVSLSSDGTIVAIGALYSGWDGSYGFCPCGEIGHVRIYEWNGSAWVQKGADIDGEAEGDSFGRSVSLSSDGTTVAIGAPGNDGAADMAGHVRIYEWNGSAWVQKGADIDGEAAYDYAGISVALSSDGTTVAIGAFEWYDTAASGYVRIYEWNGSAWVQKGADIDGEAAGDYSGESVAMSSDGTIVAIGATKNDGNGTRAGHVRVYEWNGSAWTQTGADIDGEAAYDWSGQSVAMSSDGTKVAIGARLNDGNGSKAGHVRVYSISTAAALNITYDSQDGSTVTDGDTTTTTGGAIATLPTDPTRTGYTFNGWFTAASGGTQITAGAAHNQTADFTLYAQWAANTLNITYDSQDGSDVTDGDATTTTGGSIATLPTDPTRTGYTFTGWYTAASGGTQITAGDDHGQTGDFTLYAQWAANTLSITYDSQGGSTVTDGDATTTTGGSITTLPVDPTRSGYTFTGWYTAASGGSEITAGEAHNQTTDFTLYAQWQAVPTATITTTTVASTTTTTTNAPTTTTTTSPTTTVAPTTTTTAPTTTSAPEATTTTAAPSDASTSSTTTTVPSITTTTTADSFTETDGASAESDTDSGDDDVLLAATPAGELPKTGRGYEVALWSSLLMFLGALTILVSRDEATSA